MLHRFNDTSIERIETSLYILRADEGVSLGKDHLAEIIDFFKDSLTSPAAFIVDKTSSFSLEADFLLGIGDALLQTPEIIATAVVACDLPAINSAKLEISLAPTIKSAIFPNIESATHWAKRQLCT